jgi:hypothetical protein
MHRGSQLSLTKVFVGVFSFTLVFLSAGTILVMHNPNAMADLSGMHVVMGTSQAATPGDLPTLSPIVTITPSSTPTDTPTPTPTNTPTPTPTPTNTPTPTHTPTPRPTHTPSPSPTSTPSSSPTATATSSPLPTATTGAHATPGVTATAKATGTVGNGQGSGQDSTPTDAPTALSTSPDNNHTDAPQSAQDGAFPLIDVLGGILCTVAFLFLLFIGWRQLRGHLLPAPPVKLPPSGAPPWSRERTDTPWRQTNNNQGFPPPDPAVTNGYGPVSSGIMPPSGTQQGFPVPQTGFPYQDYAGPPPSYSMDATRGYPGTPTTVSFAPDSGNLPPVTNASFPPVTDEFASIPRATNPEKAVHFNRSTRLVPMNNNDNAALPGAPPVTNGQWAGNSNGRVPNFNDPYLREMIQQYSQKGQDTFEPTG